MTDQGYMELPSPLKRGTHFYSLEGPRAEAGSVLGKGTKSMTLCIFHRWKKMEARRAWGCDSSTDAEQVLQGSEQVPSPALSTPVHSSFSITAVSKVGAEERWPQRAAPGQEEDGQKGVSLL